MPIDIKVKNIERLERMGIVVSGTKDALLSGLVKESKKFGANVVAMAMDKYLSGPRPDVLGVGTGRLRSSIRSSVDQKDDKISITVGSNVSYSAIHEKGGETHPNVTNEMRGFFWHKFDKTGDEKWKWMALTKKRQLTIRIPARPFLSTAIADMIPSFAENIGRMLGKLNFTDKSSGEIEA